MKSILEITINDVPCSVNNIWRTYRNIQTKSKKAKNFEKHFNIYKRENPINYEIMIVIDFYFNRYKVRDVDNYIKNCFDGLQNSNIIANDSLIKQVIATKYESKKTIDNKTIIKIYKWKN